MKQAMRTNLSRQLTLHGKKRLRTCRPSTYIWFMAGLIFFFSVQPLWWQARILSAASTNGAFIDHPQLEIHNTISTFHPQPRILQLDPEMNKINIIESQISLKLEPPAESYKLSKDDDDNHHSNQVCQPMHDWQTKTYPVCNHLHEIDTRPETGSLHFINCGGSRCAFNMTGSDGETVVLKIPKLKKRDIRPGDMSDARKDGLSMERLQASPYVLDIYGFCGLSQVIEVGDAGGNIHDLIKTTRLRGSETISSIDKLKIAYQIVSAVSDMHSFEKDGLVSLVHNDICCHQFILSHGVYKLNDFHLSQFQKKNKHTNEVCNSHNDYSRWYKLVRSPEEVAYFLKMSNQFETNLEKSDVYTMGNVMYYILTMHWLFEGYKTKDAELELATGKRSPFPNEILGSDDRAIHAVRKAIEMCWTHSPEERPKATQIRKFLEHELKGVLGVKGDLGVVRVTSIDPLPKDYRYSDSDFDTMFRD